MMTIRKLPCFSAFLSLSFLFSCSNVRVKQVFEGSNQEGKHSRALFDTPNGFVVGGQDGVFSVYDKDFNQVTDSLQGASDLRDVYVLADGGMIFINSGDNGRIWKISSDLKTVKLTYDRKDVFLDGIAFWNDLKGVAYGDPVNGKFVVMITVDGGEIWRPLDYNVIPYSLPNEAGFAASGTGISALGESTIYIGTGMADTARLFCSYDFGLSWQVKNTPIKAGDSYGIYSMYFWSEKEGIIVGGSYLNPDDTTNLCFYTEDGGDHWQERSGGLGGYTSCIHGTKTGDFLVATGRTGTFYSRDKGINWVNLLDETFYSVRLAADYIYFSGKEGKVAVYSYSFKD
jgi:photosystem II stability/assembly factor-like uncharacterized protein